MGSPIASAIVCSGATSVGPLINVATMLDTSSSPLQLAPWARAFASHWTSIAVSVAALGPCGSGVGSRIATAAQADVFNTGTKLEKMMAVEANTARVFMVAVLLASES